MAGALYPRVSGFVVRELETKRPVCEVAIATLASTVDAEVTKRVGGPAGPAIAVAQDNEAFRRFTEAHKRQQDERLRVQ